MINIIKNIVEIIVISVLLICKLLCYLAGIIFFVLGILFFFNVKLNGLVPETILGAIAFLSVGLFLIFLDIIWYLNDRQEAANKKEEELKKEIEMKEIFDDDDDLY